MERDEGKFCEAMFEELARANPSKLIDLLSSPNLDAADLTFAAEIAGANIPSSDIIKPLLKLLETHPRSLAREGALLGLSYHLHDKNVIDAIREASIKDSIPEIRDVASQILLMDIYVVGFTDPATGELSASSFTALNTADG